MIHQSKGFGGSVSICGEICIVGAPGTNSDTGAAYEYKLKYDKITNRTTWEQISYITAFDGEVDDDFAWSVDVFGDFVFIWAPDADTVYIYAWY